MIFTQNASNQTLVSIGGQPLVVELQGLHEIIIGSPLEKKSFRRGINNAELLIDSGKTTVVRGRPAKLYRAKASSRDYRFVRNLEE